MERRDEGKGQKSTKKIKRERDEAKEERKRNLEPCGKLIDF